MEKKGLFWRLLDFFRERIDMDETGGIGFWNDTENMEKHFAEMGAVVSLTQEETKKTFWEETAKKELQEEPEIFMEREKAFFMPTEERREKADDPAEKGNRTERFFAAEVFRNERENTEEAVKNGLGKAFLMETPAEERVVKSIVPVAEALAGKEETAAEAAREMPERESLKREEKQTDQTIDIEKLMRQMTKKLWEERESCGRRLR